MDQDRYEYGQDPMIDLMMTAEWSKAALEQGDELALARAEMRTAETLYNLARNGMDGHVGLAAEKLDSSRAVFRRHLPEARVDLAESHYLSANAARGVNWPTAREHYDAALPLLRRDSEPILYADVCDGLAASLVRGPGGDLPDTQERALLCYYDAFSVEPPAVPPERWALTAHGLMLTLAERYRGGVVDNWMAIAQIGDRALPAALEGSNHRLQNGIYELAARARLAVSIFGMLNGALTNTDALATVDWAAELLDALPADPGATTHAELAGQLRWAVERAAVVGVETAVLACIAMLARVGDRRGQIALHLQLAEHGDARAHAERAARLLHRHDAPELHQLLAEMRAT